PDAGGFQSSRPWHHAIPETRRSQTSRQTVAHLDRRIYFWQRSGLADARRDRSANFTSERLWTSLAGHDRCADSESAQPGGRWLVATCLEVPARGLSGGHVRRGVRICAPCLHAGLIDIADAGVGSTDERAIRISGAVFSGRRDSRPRHSRADGTRPSTDKRFAVAIQRRFHRPFERQRPPGGFGDYRGSAFWWSASGKRRP